MNGCARQATSWLPPHAITPWPISPGARHSSAACPPGPRVPRGPRWPHQHPSGRALWWLAPHQAPTPSPAGAPAARATHAGPAPRPPELAGPYFTGRSLPLPPAYKKGRRPSSPHPNLLQPLTPPRSLALLLPNRRLHAVRHRPFCHHQPPSLLTPNLQDRGVLEEEHEEECDRETEPEDQQHEPELPEGFEDGKSNLTL
uniref:Uncharacterized protein n=1 Tax=Setaria viridis TaxID=4556 RepID=A0A4U6TH87_SETVI|nr:hypothetical protein SEVIR_8G110000v2 [Setaria viridis]